jgi:hypothetical protein
MSKTPKYATVKVRMKPAMKREIKASAKSCFRSMNRFIMAILTRELRLAAECRYRVTPKDAERIISAELTKAAKRRTQEKL